MVVAWRFLFSFRVCSSGKISCPKTRVVMCHATILQSVKCDWFVLFGSLSLTPLQLTRSLALVRFLSNLASDRHTPRDFRTGASFCGPRL
ncbi:hypothetical protein QBC47DRAFT_128247 [Echria macrotheca]|uniref:Uncharacterized protein n=1 Tax=Echria macrotheca TaxID=438768 RepID=A0AAJ0F1H5_9PEZI|nr:hypothetical protein QBC47DRAFT_128247 [Echria macrotheca]